MVANQTIQILKADVLKFLYKHIKLLKKDKRREQATELVIHYTYIDRDVSFKEVYHKGTLLITSVISTLF